MTINTQYINDDRGQDEVVANQRTRAYVPGTPGVASVGGSGSFGTLWMSGTGVVSSQTSATGLNLTAAQIGGGIAVVSFSAAAQTLTLDTAANIQTYMNNNSGGIQIGDIIQCLLINGSATNSFTLAAGTGGAPDANQPTITLPANVSKNITIRFTAIGASPAYVVYA